MKRMVELGYKMNVNKTWVEDEDLWLHQSPDPDKIVYSFVNKGNPSYSEK
jgi:hypothetical protein